MTKQEIRVLVRERFASADHNERAEMDKDICAQIVSISRSLASCKGRGVSILLYSSLPDEVQVQEAVDTLQSMGCTVLLPIVLEDGMVLGKYTGKNTLSKGRFGIPEPSPGNGESTPEPDIAFVPGRAFTLEGDRLGRGKGYYDRFLESCQCKKIGVCYPFQIMKELPTDDYDVKMDSVII